MKKLKLLIPTIALSLTGVVVPTVTSCSEDDKIEEIKIEGDETVYFTKTYTYKAFIFIGGKWKETTEVTWSIVDLDGCGASLSENGQLTAGDFEGNVQITATSKDDPSLTFSLNVHVASPIESITITAPRISTPGGKGLFKATVKPAQESFLTAVTWSIENEYEVESRIDSQSGELTVGSKFENVTVVATSIADPNKSAKVTVSVGSYVTKFEFTGPDGLKTNGSPHDYSDDVKIEVVTGLSDHVNWNVNVGQTGSTWDSSTKTLTPGNTPGEVTMTLVPAIDKELQKVIKIQIADKFTEYDTDSNSAWVKSFNNKVSKLSDDCDSIIASTYDGKPVTSIGSHAFEYNTLQKITIPNTITNIGDYAFAESTGQMEVYFENNSQLEYIGVGAFLNSNIKYIQSLPSSINYIAAAAFAYDPSSTDHNLKSIDFSNLNSSELHIGSEIFEGRAGLESISFPNNPNFTSINSKTFNFAGLKEIEIPATITRIEESAFGSCFSLKRIKFAGNKDQWLKSERVSPWHHDAPATKIYCVADKQWAGLDETNSN